MANQEFFGDSIEEVLVKQKKRQLEVEANKAAHAASEEPKSYEGEQLSLGLRPVLPEKIDPNDAVMALVSAIAKHPEYERLQREYITIPTVNGRIGYIDRFVYEHLTDQVTVLQSPHSNLTFHHKLGTVGLPTLCPYLRLDGANKTTHQDCQLDADVLALCDGRADLCTFYQQREPAWPRCLTRECLVDLKDQEDWWQMEGKYG